MIVYTAVVGTSNSTDFTLHYEPDNTVVTDEPTTIEPSTEAKTTTTSTITSTTTTTTTPTTTPTTPAPPLRTTTQPSGVTMNAMSFATLLVVIVATIFII